MLLFESFTYDDSWASQYYDNFYNASEYLKEYLNDGYTENGEFCVKQCYSSDHETYRYKISYLNKADIFDNRFPYDAYVYVYNKLKNFGEAITIAPGCWPEEKDGDNQADIIIRYDKEKDEKRWESEHERYIKAYESNEVQECNPTVEQWIRMITAKSEKKNPNRLFAKESNLKSVAGKYIISIKIDWLEAETVLEECLSKLLTNEVYGKYTDKFPSFIKILNAYAKFKYEIDPEIQELIDDINCVEKHIGPNYIPKKYYEIAKKLDQNEFVEKYQFLHQFDDAFNIQTTNGNLGRIYIDEDEKLGKDFFFISLQLKGTHYRDMERSHSYRFKALPSIIPSVVKAIYEQNPKLLHEVIIKI